jgi:hypothetical protein
MSVLSMDDIRSQLTTVVTERRAFVERCKRDLKVAKVELKTAEKLLGRWKPTGTPARPTAAPQAAPSPAPSLGALTEAERGIRAKVLAVLKREGALPPQILWGEISGQVSADERRRVIDALVDERLIEVRGNTVAKRIALVK